MPLVVVMFAEVGEGKGEHPALIAKPSGVWMAGPEQLLGDSKELRGLLKLAVREPQGGYGQLVFLSFAGGKTLFSALFVDFPASDLVHVLPSAVHEVSAQK